MKVLLIVLLVLLGLIALPVLIVAVSSLFINPNMEYHYNCAYFRFLLNTSTGIMIILLRIRLHISGLDKIPDGRFLLVGNHRSNYDPILTWFVLRDRQIAYLSKEENFRIPAFGRIIRKCGFLPIDRNNPRRALKTLATASEMIREDEVSFAIYPEGTRSKNCLLLPFHDGIFRVAQNADVPIVVVAVQGTEKIHKQYIRKRSDVSIDFVDVIPVEEVKKMRTHEIGQRVRTTLLSVLEGEKE
ncbi:MAG: 1-acyl-sn-glycerol-3-phosphate acyltransferase [Lachnospiraceae bacterium]|nr:1-acyl-sn-glycerol-3-phosphate acyltransferase [Lachnospiraceae bacterium]